MCKIRIVAVNAILVYSLVATALAQSDQEGKFEISLSKQEFVLTESIVVSITASNPTDEKIAIYDPRRIRIQDNFVVIFEDGTALEYVGERYARVSGDPLGIHLMPGESKTAEHNLSRSFKIDKLGRYTIQVTWDPYFLIREKDGQFVWHDHNAEPRQKIMEFKVLPLNIVYEEKETRRVWGLGKRHAGPGNRQMVHVFVHEADEGDLKLFAKVSLPLTSSWSTFFCKYVGDVARGTKPEGLQDDDAHIHVLFQRPDGVYEYKKLHKNTGKVLMQEEIHGPARLHRTADGDVELIRG